MKDGRFVSTKTGPPLRVWAVNRLIVIGKPPDVLRVEARMFGKQGVNLTCLHQDSHDTRGHGRPVGEPPGRRAFKTLSAEGIDCRFSILGASWLIPAIDTRGLPSHDSTRRPFLTGRPVEPLGLDKKCCKLGKIVP